MSPILGVVGDFAQAMPKEYADFRERALRIKTEATSLNRPEVERKRPSRHSWDICEKVLPRVCIIIIIVVIVIIIIGIVIIIIIIIIITIIIINIIIIIIVVVVVVVIIIIISSSSSITFMCCFSASS